MLRFLLVVVSLFAGLKSFAELSFKPYGTVSVDAVRNSAGTLNRTSGNANYTTSSINESNHTMHIQNSRLGLTGESDLSQLNLSGKIEVDFNGENTAASDELEAEPRVLELYMMLNHKGTDVNLLLGQSNDIVAPLNPVTYDENGLAGQGNLGWYRPQARLSREFFNHLELAMSAAYPSDGREARSERFDYAIHMGVDSKDMLDSADLKIKLGAGAIDGEDTNTHSQHGREVNYAIHMTAYDFSLNWNDMLTVNGEFYEGNATGHYNGIGTFNTNSNTLPGSDGWWAQALVKVSKTTFGIGKGEAKAEEKAQSVANPNNNSNPSTVLAGSRTWANLTYEFNSQVSTGLEYAMVSTTYAENKHVDKDNERYNFNVSYKF